MRNVNHDPLLPVDRVVRRLAHTFREHRSEVKEETPQAQRVRIYDEMATFFMHLNGNTKIPEEFQKELEVVFLELNFFFLNECAIGDELTSRLMKSELFLVFDILCDPHYFREFQDALEHDEKIELFIELMRSKIASQSEFNKESTFWKHLPNFPTVGFEYESANPVVLLKNLNIQINHIVNILNQIEIDADWKAAFIEKLKYSWIDDRELWLMLVDSLDSKIELLTFLSNLSSMIKEFFSRCDKAYKESGGVFVFDDEIRRMNRIAAQYPTIRYMFSNFLFYFNSEISAIVQEVVTRPTKHIGMQHKELLHALRRRFFLGEIDNQETVSNVPLDVTDNDFMETASILTAAGYLDEPTDIVVDIYLALHNAGLTEFSEDWIIDAIKYRIDKTEMYQQVTHEKERIAHDLVAKIVDTFIEENGKEKHKKRSRTKSGDVYFPGFRRRTKNLDDSLLINYGFPSTIFVECRLLPSLRLDNPKDFIKFVRSSSFYYYSAVAKTAISHNVFNTQFRNEKAHNLWIKMQTDWSDLMNDKKIFQPSFGLRYEEYDKDGGNTPHFVKYTNSVKIISDIESFQKRKDGSSEETLRNAARRIIHDFQRGIKEIIEEELVEKKQASGTNNGDAVKTSEDKE